jgi:hypothetical protein
MEVQKMIPDAEKMKILRSLMFEEEGLWKMDE